MNILKDQTGIIGKVTVRKHPPGSIERFRRLILEAGSDPDKRARISAEIRKGEIALEQKNLVMQAVNVGKDLIVQRLLGTNTYTLNITHGAIGTNNAAPAANDTKLGTEFARSAPTFTQDSGYNEAILQFFFPDSVLTNQTYYEFGMFVDGTSSVNSGQIFNHALFSPGYAKTAGVDTTIEVDLTFN